MVNSLKIFDLLADDVDPNRAQQVTASDPGRHYSLHIEIKVDSCFVEKFRFLLTGRNKVRRLIWVDIIRCLSVWR